MQPARLGALACYFVATALLGLLVLTPVCLAQSPPIIETPEQLNDRIRSVAATLRITPHDYVIGGGDLLAIEVFDVKELSREARVSQTGTIVLPLVPVRLHVAGLTETQAAQKIAEVLEANGLVSHPDVSVIVKEHKSKPITVVGAVAHPMVYQEDRQVSLLEVLAEAGGVASDAGNTIIVTRPVEQLSAEDSSETAIMGSGAASGSASPETAPAVSAGKNAAGSGSASGSASGQEWDSAKPAAAAEASVAGIPPAPLAPPPLPNTITINLDQLMETGDMANNIMLQAGDVVTVPHAGIVYVLGAVGRPGGFVLVNDRSQMTTLKILSLAGGLTHTANRTHAVIIRKDDQGKQQQVDVDLKKVMNREVEDVKLLPSDILYVPDSPGKQALYRSLEIGIALGTGIALFRLAYQ